MTYIGRERPDCEAAKCEPVRKVDWTSQISADVSVSRVSPHGGQLLEEDGQLVLSYVDAMVGEEKRQPHSSSYHLITPVE